MKDLEHAVNAPLFGRGRRGVDLTPAGAALLSGVRELFARLDEGVSRARLAQEGQLGSVRVGLSRAALDSARVGAALNALHDSFPDAQLVVSDLALFSQSRALRSGECDIAIGLGPENDRSIQSHVLYEDRLDGAMIARSHPLAQRERLSAAELDTVPLLATPSSAKRFPDLFDTLDRLGLHSEDVDSVDTLFGLVAAGAGWTPATSSMTEAPPYGTVVRPLEGVTSPAPMMLHWRKAESSRLVMNVVQAIIGDGSRIARWRGRPASGRDTPTRLRRQEEGTPRGVELRHLRAFVTTLEERSLSRAAEKLGLTQSGLSRQVRALERDVGADLLERGAQGVVPTVAGEIFRSDAVTILRMTHSVVARAQRAARGRAELCLIGTIPLEVTSGIVVNTLRHLALEHPELDVELREMPSLSQEAALRAGSIDVGIAGGQAGQVEDSAFASVMLVDDPIDCVLVAAAHPLASRTWLHAAELANHPFVFMTRSYSPRLYDVVMQALVDLGIVPNTPVGCTGLRTVWHVTASSDGWTVAPRSLHTAPPVGLVAVPLEGLAIPWGIRLLWRRDLNNQAARQVLDVLRHSGAKET